MDILMICIFSLLGLLIFSFGAYAYLTNKVIKDQEEDYIALLEEYKELKKGGSKNAKR